MSEPTPGPVRSITEDTTVRLPLGRIFAVLSAIAAGVLVIIGSVVAAALWANNIEHKVDGNAAETRANTEEVRALRTAFEEFRAAMGVRATGVHGGNP